MLKMSKCADLILKIFRSGDCYANKGRNSVWKCGRNRMNTLSIYKVEKNMRLKKTVHMIFDVPSCMFY